MSVYEPFAADVKFEEGAALHPPRHDRYAREKVCAEQALLALPDAASWQLHLRPTVVYGPFCGVWTDRIFEAFTAGNVACHSLAGRIQPLLGADLSRFILARLTDFRAGIYNVPGPEILTWQEFFTVFQDIAASGKLQLHQAGVGDNESRWRFYASNLRELLHAVRKEPAFDRMALSIARHLPEHCVQRIRQMLFGRGERAAVVTRERGTSDYLRPFFAEDRLVSAAHIKRDFPDFKPRSVHASHDELGRYFRYRFGDDSFIA